VKFLPVKILYYWLLSRLKVLHEDGATDDLLRGGGVEFRTLVGARQPESGVGLREQLRVGLLHLRTRPSTYGLSFLILPGLGGELSVSFNFVYFLIFHDFTTEPQWLPVLFIRHFIS
jgi:hypothetical protein